ncbi:MAG: hypothetical protein CMJ25_24225 [Phycisphaerae bacterium]|nr:hypothetical protein [Phycisphaerae bacterium]
MPISFGSAESTASSNFIRSNLPQNKWWVKAEGGDEPIDMEKGFAIDIKNVTFGWLHIDVGIRDWQAWPSPSQSTPRPSDSHKQGFEVDCWLSDGREASMSGNSYGLGQFIAKMYNQAETAPEFAAGKIPVIQITGSTPVVVGKGTSYDIGFHIRTWIDKPEEKPEVVGVPPAAAEATPPSAPPTASTETDFGFN